MEETVTITKARLKELEEMKTLMIALEHSGVDNWIGYGDAQELVEEWANEDEKN